jgi:hypothetical protein
LLHKCLNVPRDFNWNGSSWVFIRLEFPKRRKSKKENLKLLSLFRLFVHSFFFNKVFSSFACFCDISLETLWEHDPSVCWPLRPQQVFERYLTKTGLFVKSWIEKGDRQNLIHFHHFLLKLKIFWPEYFYFKFCR